MKNPDVVIIGGGAAGLFCAFTAGQRGLSVLVLDSSNKVGKKILMSGGGRCNFTNLDITPENYLCNNPHFCISALTATTSGSLSIWLSSTALPTTSANTVNCSATNRQKIFSPCCWMSASKPGWRLKPVAK